MPVRPFDLIASIEAYDEAHVANPTELQLVVNAQQDLSPEERDDEIRRLILNHHMQPDDLEPLKAQIEMIDGDHHALIDMQEVEQDLCGKCGISQEDIRLIEPYFKRILDFNRVTLESFTQTPTQTNFDYVKRRMALEVAEEKEVYQLKVTDFLKACIDDITEMEGRINTIYRPYLEQQLAAIEHQYPQLKDDTAFEQHRYIGTSVDGRLSMLDMYQTPISSLARVSITDDSLQDLFEALKCFDRTIHDTVTFEVLLSIIRGSGHDRPEMSDPDEFTLRDLRPIYRTAQNVFMGQLDTLLTQYVQQRETLSSYYEQAQAGVGLTQERGVFESIHDIAESVDGTYKLTDIFKDLSIWMYYQPIIFNALYNRREIG